MSLLWTLRKQRPVKTLFIDEPASGNYILKIFGTGDGPYTIQIQGTKEWEEKGTVLFISYVLQLILNDYFTESAPSIVGGNLKATK